MKKRGEEPSKDEDLGGFSIAASFNEFREYAFPWMSDTHRDCYSRQFMNLQKAWSAHLKNPDQTKMPIFHKKGRKDSFYVSNDQFVIDEYKIRIPLIGWIRMNEKLRYDGKIMSATVSRTADKWFASIKVEIPDEKAKKPRIADGIIGVDAGINHAVTLSTGEKIEAPKPLKKALRKLRRLERRKSRRTEGGKNRKKTVKKIAMIYAKISNIRRDFWHKITTRLCRENQAIGIEKLNVAGMVKNRKLSRALSDVAFGMMKPMLEYKAKIYGNTLNITDLWFASSKTCSCCGAKKEELSLSDRAFHCEACGYTEDRDVNAAKNERNELVKFLASAKTIRPVGPEFTPVDSTACRAAG